MNSRLFFISYLLSLLVILTPKSVDAGSINNNPECNKVGIVLKSYDKGIKNASPLCESGIINIGSQLKIKVICLNNQKVRWINSGVKTVRSICTPEAPKPNYCPPGKTCRRNKLPKELFTLTHPISIINLSNRPAWKWLPIKNSTKYWIRIIPKGKPSIIDEYVSSAEFTVTHKYPQLDRGNLYDAVITAFGNNKQFLSEATFSLYVLSNDEFEELKQDIQSIANFSLSQEDKILYTDTLYMDLGLLDETITYLEKQTVKTAAVWLRLGDRYLQAQRLANAEKAYQAAINISEEGMAIHAYALARLDDIKELKSEIIQ